MTHALINININKCAHLLFYWKCLGRDNSRPSNIWKGRQDNTLCFPDFSPFWLLYKNVPNPFKHWSINPWSNILKKWSYFMGGKNRINQQSGKRIQQQVNLIDSQNANTAEQYPECIIFRPISTYLKETPLPSCCWTSHKHRLKMCCRNESSKSCCPKGNESH